MGISREEIFKEIRDDITYGKLTPGERLVEARLVDRFKTSRSPIREALRQLESEGLISFKRNKGISVSKLSIDEVKEIYNVRVILEGYATRLTADKFLKKDMVYLEDLQEKLKKGAQKHDLAEYIRNNILFHEYFLQNCENALLQQMLDSLRRKVRRYSHTVLNFAGHFKLYLEQHERILRSCEKNNGKMAEHFMKIHIETTQKYLIDYLKTFPI